MNVTIGEKKTFDDWKLKLRSLVIGLPEVKTNTVDIPGADGMMDLTEALGSVRYGSRDIELTFDLMGEPKVWHSQMSQIANYLHGRRLQITLDSDPAYYYTGRLELNSKKSDYLMNEVVITGIMDPYKYELQSSLDDWLWDILDLENGIIREYGGLEVNGSLSVTIPGTRKEIIPTITASAAMEVEWRGQRYEVPAGESKIYAISLVEGDNVLIFHGNGRVSIEYRGGIL